MQKYKISKYDKSWNEYLWVRFVFATVWFVAIAQAAALLWSTPLATRQLSFDRELNYPHRTTTEHEIIVKTMPNKKTELWALDFSSLNISLSEMAAISGVVFAILLSLSIVTIDYQRFLWTSYNKPVDASSGQGDGDESSNGFQKYKLPEAELKTLLKSRDLLYSLHNLLLIVVTFYMVLVSLYGFSEISDYIKTGNSLYPNLLFADYIKFAWPGLFHPRVSVFIFIAIFSCVYVFTITFIFNGEAVNDLIAFADDSLQKYYVFRILGQFGMRSSDIREFIHAAEGDIKNEKQRFDGDEAKEEKSTYEDDEVYEEYSQSDMNIFSRIIISPCISFLVTFVLLLSIAILFGVEANYFNSEISSLRFGAMLLVLALFLMCLVVLPLQLSRIHLKLYLGATALNPTHKFACLVFFLLVSTSICLKFSYSHDYAAIVIFLLMVAFAGLGQILIWSKVANSISDVTQFIGPNGNFDYRIVGSVLAREGRLGLISILAIWEIYIVLKLIERTILSVQDSD